MAYITENFSKGSLFSALDIDDTTMYVSSGHSLPEITSRYFMATIWYESTYPDPSDDGSVEIVQCEFSGTTNKYYITREQEGTDASSHAAGSTIALTITAAVFEELRQTDEEIRDVIGDILDDGSVGNVTFHYDDQDSAGGVIYANAVLYTDEDAQDAVGSILDDGTLGSLIFTYSGGAIYGEVQHLLISGDTIGIGEDALSDLTDGNGNIAIGEGVLQGITTGDYNTGVGDRSLYAATGNASGNTAIGRAAMYNATSALNNTAIGIGACYGLTEGSYNVGIGYYSANYNETGNFNVTIGYQSAGYGAGGANSFDYNTVIGTYAGYTLQTGCSNVFLGYKAGYNQTTLSDRLIIDNDDRGSVANEITNSLIYGVFDADPANQTLRINAVVNVSQSLEVGGNEISDNSGNLTSANGLASFDGAVTNLTIVNGIVTAAS